MESYPAEPSGNVDAGAASCGVPAASTARATIRNDPLRGGVQSRVHRTHVTSDFGELRVADFHVAPPSVLTSTAEMPRSPAKAIPPIWTTPPTTVLSAGVAMIAVVWIGPRFVQPFCCQYPRYSPCVASIFVSHFAWNIP